MSDKLPTYALDFLYYLETIKGKSHHTIVNYKCNLIEFFQYLNNDSIEYLQSLKISDIHRYIIDVKQTKQIKNVTVINKIATIRSFFNYLNTKAKLLSVNISKELEYPNKPSLQPIYLTLEESIKLLSVVSGRNKTRDYAILTLFLNCGLRLSPAILNW